MSKINSEMSNKEIKALELAGKFFRDLSGKPPGVITKVNGLIGQKKGERYLTIQRSVKGEYGKDEKILEEDWKDLDIK